MKELLDMAWREETVAGLLLGYGAFLFWTYYCYRQYAWGRHLGDFMSRAAAFGGLTLAMIMIAIVAIPLGGRMAPALPDTMILVLVVLLVIGGVGRLLQYVREQTKRLRAGG
ncbi:hypothetical protein HY375_03870 [Candidatus Berkelbacteria bacterium]|nr:hypothetical protein [Candidatus Berkelbacteria bacterium]